MANSLPQVSYDSFADVLYVTIRDVPAISREEDAPGVYWRYDMSDKRTLVGVTIIDFESYWAQHIDDLIKVIAAKFNVSNAKAAKLLEAA